MWMLPEGIKAQMPHFTHTWFRCWVMVNVVYFGVGFIWCYFAYFCFGDVLYSQGAIPGMKDVVEQMKVGESAR